MRLGILLVLLAFAPFGSALAQDAFGDWHGHIGPGILDLEVFVTLTGDEESAAGTISIPAQGAFDVPLGDVTVDGDQVGFAIAGIPGDPRFDGTVAADVMSGTFTQGGQPIPFLLERSSEGPAQLNRPQEPEPPFPYEETEVVFDSLDDSTDEPIVLAGSLVIPEGDGPFPAVLFITGSGPQDRNEDLFGHRPFLVIADHLARAGYASLRVDDRGVGGSSGSDAEATYDQMAADALAGVALLAGHPDIDPAAIGLLGHSQGGYLAPVVAGLSDDVAFVISLAGPSVTGAEVLLLQNRRVIETSPEAAELSPDELEAAIQSQLAFISGLLDHLTGDDGAGADLAAAEQHIRDYYAEQLAEVPEDARPSDEELEMIMQQVIDSTLTASMISFLQFDPQPSLEALAVPYLGIYGGRDVQVIAEQNEGPAAEALERGGNPDWTVLVLDELNHLMQPAETGNPFEYQLIEITVDPAVLELIKEWLAERF